MKEIEYLKSLHQEIKDYTKNNQELADSHHWLFDLPPFKDEMLNPKYIVFGINPGEGKDDWAIWPQQTEETRFFDLHEEPDKKGRREQLAWTRKILNILGTRKIIQTELFFWSTKTENILIEKYGAHKNNPHLPFCSSLNKKLIGFHKPEAIICPGLGMIKVISKEFSLTHKASVKAPNGHRLIEHYTDNDKRDWVFTKHWSGARTFTTEQKEKIKEFIRKLNK